MAEELESETVLITVTNTGTGEMTVEIVEDRDDPITNGGLAIEERRERDGGSADDFGSYEVGNPIKIKEED